MDHQTCSIHTPTEGIPSEETERFGCRAESPALALNRNYSHSYYFILSCRYKKIFLLTQMQKL